MQDHKKDAEYIPREKKEYVVTMLIRDKQYYYKDFPVSAESAAHAIHQVTDWLLDNTNSCTWDDFEFKYVKKRGRNDE